MKFFKRETCERFIEMGMASSSETCWCDDLDRYFKKPKRVLIASIISDNPDFKFYPAFTALDFLGDTDQARKNCEILWGNLNHLTVKGLSEHSSPEEIIDHGKFWETRRHQMLDSEDQIAFVEGFLNK